MMKTKSNPTPFLTALAFVDLPVAPSSAPPDTPLSDYSLWQMAQPESPEFDPAKALNQAVLAQRKNRSSKTKITSTTPPNWGRLPKAAAPPVAVAQLAAKIDQVKNTAALTEIKTAITEGQLSLFDIAPWPDSQRASPWLLGASALFTVRNARTPREYRETFHLYHVNKEVLITYTGSELRAADDQLVFLQVLEYAKRVPIGAKVCFTFYDLCEILGWHSNGTYYRTAEKCLTRLMATSLQISSPRSGHLESISLIRRFRILNKGKNNQTCEIEIDPEIVMLFAGNDYPKFAWKQFLSLPPIARRLFDYFALHREPFPLSLKDFCGMTGSQSSRANKWAEQVRGAVEALKTSGLVTDVWISNGKVFCKR
jgi:hypothetical protein